MPRLFKFSIARSLVILENPFLLLSSKQPLTVNVSKPKVLRKIKFKDSDDIVIWAGLFVTTSFSSNKLRRKVLLRSSRWIINGPKNLTGENVLTSQINDFELFAKTLSRYFWKDSFKHSKSVEMYLLRFCRFTNWNFCSQKRVDCMRQILVIKLL